MDARLRRLLKQTSRSFYLSIRVLPAAIRPQIGLAYLLARTTDAVADARGIAVEQKRETIRCMMAAISSAAEGEAVSPPDLSSVARQLDPAENLLMSSFARSQGSLARLEEGDRHRIGEVLTTITSGQELDLDRFGNAGEDRIAALETDAELDDYTYRVAGCVGEFWTRMCRAHLFPKSELDDAGLLINGVRFGKGLQLVNILRDLPRDLRQGRCYIPRARLEQNALMPRDLLDTTASDRFRPLYRTYLDLADGHLEAGWAYIAALPRRQARVRLACVWPLLIGSRTLELLRAGYVLAGGPPVKVSRSEVRRLMLSSLRYLWKE